MAATRGHYHVRDCILPLAHLADPCTALESVGLIPSAPSLRPADLLSSAAIPGRMAALDIGVTSPDAMGAGDDCCETTFARKRRDYSRFLREMEEEQGHYRRQRHHVIRLPVIAALSHLWVRAPAEAKFGVIDGVTE